MSAELFVESGFKNYCECSVLILLSAVSINAVIC